MPLVRISYTEGKPAGAAKALSIAVQDALMACFDVVADDCFQVITAHPAGLENGPGLVGPEQFLGIDHTADLVIVQITCADGRTLDQKKALYAAIAVNIAATTDIRADDVIINLVESPRENWSFGNGV
ncbi:MAG: tautomerase family protein [Rhodospirillaceae bacterium]|jgi:phenylpyruvate tautomerase PptA (4-oxalocrotonate tautomerase family)|nr:tautomerase family protein [Rhodospirillaceae bacterium]MBT5299423.1 tautomerase family protein [Rhodospirillaceae bacterium]MBT5513490.1 tautomerase family protein [Rhodospirillaceae bacterium]MBT6086007.1 tautomerase family protein [Rhodospirillaceae bacterium]MBT6608824.1 tautomerase family protein [Rhodospirillaceae bacterium]